MIRLLLTVVLLSGCQSPAMAYTVNQWANAIFKAEGIRSMHPYGILARYKHTTPRQACINTIKHRYSLWVNQGRPGNFIAYLASVYAPVGSNTDNGTNQFWAKNVSYFLNKG